MLDPNSDYVRLAHVREGAHPLLTARYARVTNDVAVWRDGPEADRRLRLRLRLRFADLDPSTQAAVLGLDPVRDREEYAALSELLRLQKHGEPLIIDIAQLADSDLPGARALALRARNIGFVRLGASGTPQQPSAPSCGAARPHGPMHGGRRGRSARQRSSGSLPRPSCRRRGGRGTSLEPCLSVLVDEAHNICSADPRDEAGERIFLHRHGGADRRGRAQGTDRTCSTLTQRLTQVHRNVAVPVRKIFFFGDNLLLMSMNSES